MPGMSHVLTPRLMALGDEAILSYETVREGQIAGLPHVSRLHNIKVTLFSEHILEAL